MPALTVPDPPPAQDDSSVLPDHPNPSLRTAPPRPQRPPPDGVYAHAHFDPNGAPPFYDRVYPPLFPSQFISPPLSSAMFTYFAHPQATASWQPHVQLIHHNPYPPPQPPLLVHKVWILDCKSCGTFLTNRGMKAVLLLRPNVSLFSTDALPVNCSAYSTNPDALRPPPCRPSSTSSNPRTCECLTQTLCCHTCGTAVGYMIVIPCLRCTSSISTTNRATNGHRFVFHSSEIMASERHHIPDEPGVLPVEYSATPPPPSSPPPLAPAYPAVLQHTDIPTHRRLSSYVPQAIRSLHMASDYQLASRMESPESISSYSHFSPPPLTSISPTSPRRSPGSSLRAPLTRNIGSQTIPETRGVATGPSPRKLKAGDALYWHHLTKHGEIPEVQEDPRARIPSRRDVFRFFER